MKRYLLKTATMVLSLSLVFGLCGFSKAQTASSNSDVSIDLATPNAKVNDDGSKTYTYNINGIKDIYTIPPKGFQPLKQLIGLNVMLL